MADCKICGQHVNLFDAFYYKGKPVHYECGQKELKKKSGECEYCGENVDNKSKHMQQFHEALISREYGVEGRKTCPNCGRDNLDMNQKCDNCLKPFASERIVDDFINSSDNNGVSLSGISKSWWDNNANPSQKANILNKTGSPVENTLNLPNYDELSQQTKTYLDTRNDFSFENKANEDHWDEIEKETGKLDGKGRLNWIDNRINQLHKQDPRTYDEWKADRNYELGFEESYAGENKTFTCSFCGKVGTDFSDMAKEECPNNGGSGHQIPIFGDMKKSGEAGLYGYGSATGRMSPAESWNQMYLGGDVYTGARKVSDQAMGIMREYEGFKWDQLPADIQELWKSMGDYMPSGEAKYDKDHKYDYKSWTENPDGTVNVNDKDNEQIQALMDELGESWDFKNNEERWTTFERIGFKSNEAIVMANLTWSDLSLPIKAKICEVQDSDKEAKREEDKLAFNNAGEQPDTTTGQDIDYNKIFENTLIRTKYECEHCNAGFKSNESLMTHFNDTHARETDGNGCLYCKENIAPENMVEHLAYEHAFIAGESKKKAHEDWDVTKLDNHYLNSFRKIGEDYYECKYCGKDGFYPDKDEAEMKAHIKKHEGGEGYWVNSNPFDLTSEMVYVDEDIPITPAPKPRKTENIANEDDMDDAISEIPLKDRSVSKDEFLNSIGRGKKSKEGLAKVSLENFTGKCPECGTYVEDTPDEYCLNCGASFDENDNVSESYEAEDEDRYADDGYGERKIDTGSPMFDNGSEGNPNHANDGKFTSGNDKTNYSEKKDVYFKGKDGKIEKKSMSLRQYKKASKTHDGDSGWGQGGVARDLEREYNKQNESYEENDLECPECNSSKIYKNRGKGDSRFGQGEYACNNCGATFDSSNEAHVWGDWFDSNFKEEYTMDQDGAYRCKHCDAWFDMYGTYGSFTPQEVAKYHLKKEHGIGEAKPKERNLSDIVNQVNNNNAPEDGWNDEDKVANEYTEDEANQDQWVSDNYGTPANQIQSTNARQAGGDDRLGSPVRNGLIEEAIAKEWIDIDNEYESFMRRGDKSGNDWINHAVDLGWSRDTANKHHMDSVLKAFTPEEIKKYDLGYHTFHENTINEDNCPEGYGWNKTEFTCDEK